MHVIHLQPGSRLAPKISAGRIEGFGAAASLEMNIESVPIAASNSSVTLPRLLRVQEGAATAKTTTTARAIGIPRKIIII